MDSNIWYSIDFETSDINRYSCEVDRVCVLAFNIKTGKVYWKMDFGRNGSACDDHKLKGLMASPNPKVAHNAEYELYIMEDRLGFPIKGTLYDTMLMTKHWRNDLSAYDLKSLSWWLFGDLYSPLIKLREWIHKNNMKGEDDIEFDMTKCPDKLVHNYCMHDVKMTAKIATMMWPEVKDNYAHHLDTKVIRINSRIEANGITADVPFYKDFIRLGERRIKRNTGQAKEALGIDKKDKRKPTGNALRDHLKSIGESRTTETGLIKADDKVLRDHKDDEASRAVGRIRTDQKQVNTYARNILLVANELGSFHPNLRQSSAITRRWRSSNLYGDNGVTVKGNVQSFPRGVGIRSGIITPEGYGFVKFDLASIEARVGAHAMAIFLGFDYYVKKYRANDKFNIYQHVIEHHTSHGKVTKKDPLYTAYKHGCLGIQYGVGVKTFHKTMVDSFDLPYSLEECAHIYNTIREECPEFTQLQRAVSSIIEKEGKIYDDYGAVYYVPDSESYKGVNCYCQGCATNIFKDWMTRVDPMLADTKDYIFCLLHDEQDGAIWRDKTANKRIQAYCDVMRQIDHFELPLTAEASGLVDNWAEAG